MRQRPRLKLCRNRIAEGLVAALPIKTLRSIEGSPAEPPPASVQAMMNQFPFQDTEEALDAGFVLAIPFSRHADSHAGRPEWLVKQQPPCWCMR